jgi:hypothetical protein
VPFSILGLPGVAKLIIDANHAEDQNHTGTSTRSALTTAILESAYTHQQNASGKRLGVVPLKSTSSSLGLNQFKNLSKAKAIQDERKAKKAEAQLRDVGIKVVATIWMSDKNKLAQVCPNHQLLMSDIYKWNY